MTPTWRAANSREVGLEVRVDTAGNIIERHNGSQELPMITFGSHVDLVPGGGIYGCDLGVNAGIEVAQVPRPTALGCSFTNIHAEPPSIEPIGRSGTSRSSSPGREFSGIQREHIGRCKSPWT